MHSFSLQYSSFLAFKSSQAGNAFITILQSFNGPQLYHFGPSKLTDEVLGSPGLDEMTFFGGPFPP
jgi:hypothetical protein